MAPKHLTARSTGGGSMVRCDCGWVGSWVNWANHAQLNDADDELAAARAEIDRLRQFAFGDAPEWEKANSTLKHRVREVEAENERLRVGLSELLLYARGNQHVLDKIHGLLDGTDAS